ncbi:hypothetical protein BDZ89DRAFT_1244180 [Hymenopellis radicata]|nr:hypothetical protein BDZ89DRAFT_1244180 [Hymenopellis radicata]
MLVNPQPPCAATMQDTSSAKQKAQKIAAEERTLHERGLTRRRLLVVSQKRDEDSRQEASRRRQYQTRGSEMARLPGEDLARGIASYGRSRPDAGSAQISAVLRIVDEEFLTSAVQRQAPKVSRLGRAGAGSVRRLSRGRRCLGSAGETVFGRAGAARGWALTEPEEERGRAAEGDAGLEQFFLQPKAGPSFGDGQNNDEAEDVGRGLTAGVIEAPSISQRPAA